LEAVLAGTELPSEDVALIAAKLSVPTGERYSQLDRSPQRRKERTYASMYRRLASRARVEPVLLSFEDAHWADPSSLELIDGLPDRLAEMPILLVISYRPEFADPWIGHAGTALITLSRLDRRQSAMLAAQVTAQRMLPRALLDRIVAQTDGVPLFIEESTKAVLETDTGTGGTVSLTVPGTLQASLMARLDRLPAAKQVAQIGAVIGREFPLCAVGSHGGTTPAPACPRSRGTCRLGVGFSTWRRYGRHLHVQARNGAGRCLRHVAAQPTPAASRAGRGYA
jgi:predicted ATPase